MAARSHSVIGDFREAGLFGRLSGLALMATVLLGVGACTELPFGSEERAASAPAEVDPPPVEVNLDAVLQRALPPPRGPATVSPAPPMPREKPALLLTVSEGETLHGIAHRHGVAARTLIALNGLSHPYWLLVGQQLRLPLEANSAARRGELPEEQAPRATRVDRRIAVAELGAPAVFEPSAEDEHVVAAPPRAPAYEESAAAAEVSAPSDDADAVLINPEPIDFAALHVEPAPSAPPPRPVSTTRSNSAEVPLPPTRDTFLWPIEGRVISRFGSKPGGMHNDGINIAVPVGSEVRAAQNGVVAYAGNELRGYGNLVLIRHKDGWMTAYAHNDSLLVGKGDVVRRGQVISRSGKSGRVSRPQAHFEIRRDGKPQDPLRLLTRK